MANLEARGRKKKKGARQAVKVNFIGMSRTQLRACEVQDETRRLTWPNRGSHVSVPSPVPYVLTAVYGKT
jgi:hypothetical protein